MSVILPCSRITSFRKSFNKSLLASEPNSFLKPKSVKGLRYFGDVSMALLFYMPHKSRQISVCRQSSDIASKKV
ncbi:hypothetical protein Barb4_03303 [Bacteroidales bacterium Barb4]|nr:hypothetical protein Barb4_03303 [Bacteroidales bacterium Barb4]